MKTNELLPPSTAIRLVWACTGTFSKDKDLRLSPISVCEAMKDIRSLSGKIPPSKNEENNKKEKEYLARAEIAMNSCLRSIHTLYKGRELNFKENEELREAYIKSLKESIDFGNKLRDLLKSLPTMTIGGVSGYTVIKYFSDGFFIKYLDGYSVGNGWRPQFYDISAWVIAILGIAFGYFFNDLVLMKWTHKRKQMLYIISDYERNIYYEHYLGHASALLRSLYQDLNQIYREIFGNPEYEENMDEINKTIEDLLKGAQPEHCHYYYEHMKKKRITPGKWAMCETGFEEDLERCPHWKYEKRQEEFRNLKEVWHWYEKLSYLGIRAFLGEIVWYRIRTWFGRFWYVRLDY